MKKVLLYIIVLAAACRLSAQMMTSAATPLNILAPQWKMGITAEAAGEFALPADISDGLDGDVGVYSASANAKFQGAYNDRHFLTLSLGYSYWQYDFSSDNAPFSSMNKTSALAFYTGRINERWGAFAIAGASFGSQVGESMWGGRTVAAGGGASYSFSPDLTVGLGGLAYSRLDNTWIGLPVGFIDWKICDRLRLRTFSGAALFYDVFGDNSLVLNLTGEYCNSYYRLGERAGNRRSVSDSYFQLSAGAAYNFSQRAYVGACVGGNFGRELDMRTNSRSAEEIEIDSAPFFGLRAGVSF